VCVYEEERERERMVYSNESEMVLCAMQGWRGEGKECVVRLGDEGESGLVGMETDSGVGMCASVSFSCRVMEVIA
jgi:hypothetical protein